MRTLKIEQARVICLRAVVLFLLGASQAVAGGVSYAVRVTAFEAGEGTKARFVVEGTSEEMMPGCRVVEVVAEYRPRRWASNERNVTREAHLKALKRLREAHESRSDARLGIMGGSGLGREASDRPCVFRTRGLALLQEQPGAYVVYSMYQYP